MEKYVVLGAGGYLSDIIDIIHANNGEIVKVFKNIPEKIKKNSISISERLSYLSYKVELYDSMDEFNYSPEFKYILGFTTVQKYRFIEYLKSKYNLTLTTLVHPEAYLGSNVHLGEGVLIAPRAVIAPNVYLDDHAVVNRSSVVGHEVRIGKYALIAPAVALAGSCRIGDYCNIGMNASVLDSVEVNKWSVVGAGSVVTKDIPEGVVAFGSPARIIRENENRDFNNYKLIRNM